MEQLDALLAHLPERHRAALVWFIAHAGTDEPWPRPLRDGTLLASRAKGIYKPSWTDYALSVRQSLGGPYPDREPVVRPDGTWSYVYFQEGADPETRDSAYANRGLIACLRDLVPVGVMRQASRKPRSLYRILGAALVAGWEEGYFFLEGFAPDGQAHGRGPLAQIDALRSSQERNDLSAGTFDPESLIDARERTIASIVRRRGQPDFRMKLLEAYGGRCALTGCDAVEALEAAHVVPYLGPNTNHPSNGMLLRADIHTLFDLGLIAVETASMTVLVAPSLAGTSYGELAGRRVRVPSNAGSRPSKKALDQHRAWARL